MKKGCVWYGLGWTWFGRPRVDNGTTANIQQNANFLEHTSLYVITNTLAVGLLDDLDSIAFPESQARQAYFSCRHNSCSLSMGGVAAQRKIRSVDRNGDSTIKTASYL